MKNIRIGTMVRAGANSGSYIREIIPYGFECFALTYPSGSYQGVSPEEVAEKEIELSYMPDDNGYGVYKALEADLGTDTNQLKTKWMTAWTSQLMLATPAA